jgi:FkbM family methyltransferase
MFLKHNKINNKIANISWRIFNKFENNGNADFHANGEIFFIKNLFKYYSKSEPTKIIIFDIGANLGDYSETLIDNKVKNNVIVDIHLFEPTAKCFEELTSKFSFNKNIVLNNFGLSNSSDSCTIFYDQEKSGLASLYKRNLEHYDINFELSETVEIKRADRYIKENNIEHIDFVKIDIEGHELKAFEGFGEYLRDDFVDVIQFEYGGANLDSHVSLMEINNFFKKRNFKLFKIMRHGLEARSYQPYMENFMNSNYVVMSKNMIDKINQ